MALIEHDRKPFSCCYDELIFLFYIWAQVNIGQVNICTINTLQIVFIFTKEKRTSKIMDLFVYSYHDWLNYHHTYVIFPWRLFFVGCYHKCIRMTSSQVDWYILMRDDYGVKVHVYIMNGGVLLILSFKVKW